MLLSKVRVVALVLGLAGSAVWGQTFESLYSFPADDSDGAEPQATLTVGPDGSLYGTATVGGSNDAGTIFKVSLAGEVVILDDFETNSTGKNPYARLVSIGDEFLYGVTNANGSTTGDPAGTVYRLDLNVGLSVVSPLRLATGTFPRKPVSIVAAEQGALHVLGNEPGGLWRVPLNGEAATVTRNFTGTVAEGSFHERMIRGSDGFLYGGSYAGGDKSRGILFRIAPDGSSFTRLHSCDYDTGIRPIGAMVEAPDGSFYGTMSEAGLSNGVIYRITPTGDYTVLHYFKDLRYPEGDLMIATDGFIYGTAWDLGPGGNGNGGIFRIRPNGTGYQVVYCFTTKSTEPFYPNGRTPLGGLVQGADGYLYGTTKKGGLYDRGTIFRLKLKLPPPPVNQQPVAVDDVAVSSGAPVLINVLANDFDPNDDALTVEILNGPSAGTATAQPGGQILYTPDASYAGTDAFTYKVSDGRGGVATARVSITSTTPGPLVRQGVYNGLLGPDPELDLQIDVARAQFVLAVQSSGRFTGVLYTKKKRVTFRGTFDDNGVAVTAIKMPDKKLALLYLAFRAGEPNSIVGALFSSEIWSGVAGPVRSSDSSATEKYTVVFGADSSMADGYGYGIMQVSRSGLVAAAGKLGDGTRFSWGTSLVSLPNRPLALPVFSEPLKGGVCSGVLAPRALPAVTATAAGGLDLSGVLRWIRPAATKLTKPYAFGFNGQVEVVASHFVPPSSTDGVLTFDSGIATLGNGPVQGTVDGTFTIDGNKVQTSSPLRGLSFNRKTGLFSGKMQVGRKTLNFQGVVGQTLRRGFGQFSVGGVTGSVLLQTDVIF
ncbi:choice-of-anchor tandem repeat GloVer-containing protein [Verrucomicrobiota bacterium sgz303538]